MKVILHIGLAKTGTTTLQQWLNENYETLERSKILYSKDFLHDGAAHHKIPIYIKNSNYLELMNILEGISNQYSFRYNTLIFSSEEFSTLSSEQIKKFASIINSIFEKVEIVITIRPHFSLFIGQYKQQIREAYISLNISEYWYLAQKHAKYLQLTKFIKTWKDAFKLNNNNIIPICTESNIYDYNGDIIEQFCKIYDIKYTKNKSFTNKNKSLSSMQNRVLIEIKKTQEWLWSDNIEWDMRRFAYLLYQYQNTIFNKLSDIEDKETLYNELLVLSSFKYNYYKEWEQLSIYGNNKYKLPNAEQIKHWYSYKFKEIEKKIAKYNCKINDYIVNDKLLYDDIFQKSIKFYQDNQNKMKTLGPSEQLLIYLKNRRNDEY